jgi:eukaryotic-like serine/threonine-protein kinase
MGDLGSRTEALAAALQDRYRIERELGRGGMATVYVAEDVRHHRRVAIKVLRPELVAVVGAERFLREIRTTATMQHSHILGLIDSGEFGGLPYYVMPFVDGESNPHANYDISPTGRRSSWCGARPRGGSW